MAKQKAPAIKKTTKKKPATRGKAGRPPINEPTDVEAIQAKIDAYFNGLAYADADGIDQMRDPTYCGLALAVGYASRQTLWVNSKTDSQISLPLKRAMLMIEESYEKGLRFQACTGSIFALKNKGWSDKPENEDGGMDSRLTIDFTE